MEMRRYSTKPIYYVYLLLTPRKFFLPFYVGKGKKDREGWHLTEDAQVNDPNKHKQNTINAIRNKKLKSPNGEEFLILGENINPFIRENGFDRANLIQYGHSKGWVY